jgi:hypothetical protein
MDPVIHEIDMKKRYKAVVTTLDGVNIRVYSTTHTPASSYGLQHWVSEDGTPFGQINLHHPQYNIRMIEEVSEEEAEKWERYHGIA